MKFDVLKSQILILSTSGAPLREINHPAFMQPRYSKSADMLRYSVRLLLHYLRYNQIPVFN